jgi:acyl carrier protein
VSLARLPRTLSGKVDYRALPATFQAAAGAVHVAPRSETELMIATIWQEVLAVETVGVEDNFFDVGGHSLKLVEVHARLQHEVGRDIPLVELFRYPTVSDLAGYVASRERCAANEGAVLTIADQRGARQRAALGRLRAKLAGEVGPP